MSQWHDAGSFDLSFLWAPWPETITRTDLITNYFVYIPFGIFAARAFFWHHFTLNNWLWMCALGAGLSLILECAQLFVPQRVASNVDIAANLLGTAFGAAISPLFSSRGKLFLHLSVVRRRWFRPGWIVNMGFILLALWILSQINLQAPSLMAGALHLGFLPYWDPHALAEFKSVTALIFALEIASLGLFVSILLRPDQGILPAVIMLTIGAVLFKFAAAALLVKFSVLTRLLSLEVIFGIGFGAFAMFAFVYFRDGKPSYPIVAGVLCSFILIKLFHGLPYMTVTGITPDLATKPQVLFNITGVAYLVAETWPYLALGSVLALWEKEQ